MAFVDTEQYTAGEVRQKVGRLKLSEALKSGAGPLCKTLPFLNEGACALMSAYEVATHSPRGSYSWEQVERFWKRAISHEIMMDVIHKNREGESRESIATWLESMGL